METAVAAYDEESGPDRLQRIVVLIGLGYIALVTVAVYVDYKVQMRRARKRREAQEAEGRTTSEEDGPER